MSVIRRRMCLRNPQWLRRRVKWLWLCNSRMITFLRIWMRGNVFIIHLGKCDSRRIWLIGFTFEDGTIQGCISQGQSEIRSRRKSVWLRNLWSSPMRSNRMITSWFLGQRVSSRLSPLKNSGHWCCLSRMILYSLPVNSCKQGSNTFKCRIRKSLLILLSCFNSSDGFLPPPLPKY